MVFRGYIDESYDTKLFTLSCLMARPSDWMWIELAWRKVIRNKNRELKRSGRPLVSRYHATHCNGRRGEFSGWTSGEQIEFVKALLSIFHRHMTNAVVYSIPIEDFKEVFPEHHADPIPQMYGFLIKFLLIEMDTQFQEIIEGYRAKPIRVALFHDRSNHDAVILDAFNQILNDPTFPRKERFTSITAMGWEDCIPLQAADMMAYETFKDITGRMAGRNRRKTMDSILSSDLFSGRAATFSRATLLKLRQRMGGG